VIPIAEWEEKPYFVPRGAIHTTETDSDGRTHIHDRRHRAGRDKLDPRLLRGVPRTRRSRSLSAGTTTRTSPPAIDVIALNVERGEEGIPGARDRIRGLRGDVLLDRCGLSGADLDRIVAETTYIIHGAATITVRPSDRRGARGELRGNAEDARDRGAVRGEREAEAVRLHRHLVGLGPARGGRHGRRNSRRGSGSSTRTNSPNANRNGSSATILTGSPPSYSGPASSSAIRGPAQRAPST
jgi:hypothetical protein